MSVPAPSVKPLAILSLCLLVTMVALARMASRLFWKDESARCAPEGGRTGLAPVAGLAVAIVAVAVAAGPVQRYTAAAAAQVREPGPYIERLLGERPVRAEWGLR